MPVWKIAPSAAPDDPRWANAQIWTDVTVNAGTSGQARAMAAAMEAREMGYHPDASQVGTQAMSLPSAFLDPTLYSVRRTSEAVGAAGVIDAMKGLRGASADSVPG